MPITKITNHAQQKLLEEMRIIPKPEFTDVSLDKYREYQELKKFRQDQGI